MTTVATYSTNKPVTDWQGNNAAVVSSSGSIEQQTIYYPYGEPTIEPGGQRYLFGGKEREHAGGRNSYVFGARSLTPYGRWGVPDSEAESFYQYSPYTYCAGDPINYVDPDGKWKIRLFKNTEGNKDLLHNTRNIGFDDKIHVIGHGYTRGIDYEKKNRLIKSGKALMDAIKVEFKDISKLDFVDIILT